MATVDAAACKCYPSDTCWPSSADFNTLNETVGGRLIETLPIGSPCHDPNYNAKDCIDLQQQWRSELLHLSSSSSVMQPFFANNSCDPFQPRQIPCQLGNYVRYAVNASSVEDVQAAVNFAREKNIRFVIRNTGHDYLGRSTGAGSLSVWTHYLKGIEVVDFSSVGYSGKAMKFGAGIQGFEAMEVGKAHGLIVVGGECPTVGLAGGYTQGGGHSALSTSFGLAADNALSWEIVLSNGSFVTASRKENEDLFWALSGGGASTYGVVTSLTVKAHADSKVGGAFLIFLADKNDPETFYNAIRVFHDMLPRFVDAGTMVVYTFTKSYFIMSPVTAYNKSKAQVQGIVGPFIREVKALGLLHYNFFTESDSYYDHYNTFFGPLPYGLIKIGGSQYAGRLIPRSVITDITLTNTSREIVEQNVVWVGVATNVGPHGSNTTSSVNPAWRDALVHAVVTVPFNFTAAWQHNVALQDKLTNNIMPLLEAITPGSGSYVNEGDFRQPYFQEVFWGSNYEKLLGIKK
ncbi:hypothetical protein JX265_009046 [Neoarthrinium moseri]|uniref:FAD-binding PCMH-type domain-containing protein n=1 Tax=Neoarthrinium moseri TaxID=1658444 RepID=A0A9Q0AN60_9PEZI|nr:hypothetical protein JX265_009046 [Neoarthrinium moseri]